MSNPDDDKKVKVPSFTLTPPPPPPPSIEEITGGITRGTPGAGIAPLTAPPEPPAARAAAGIENEERARYQQEISQLQQQISQLQQGIEQKDAEIAEFHGSFQEIQDQLRDVGDIIKAKDAEVDQYRGTMDLLQAELKNKDSSLFRAKAKIEVLEESLSKLKRESLVTQKKSEDVEATRATLEGEIQVLRRERDELQQQLDATTTTSDTDIEQLRAEKFQINERLSRRMEEVEELKARILEKDKVIANLNQELEAAAQAVPPPVEPVTPTVQFTEGTSIVSGLDNIMLLFNRLLDDALHNVFLVMPSIQDVKQIDLVKLKRHVKIQVACKIDMRTQADLDLYQNLKDLNNIDFRSFDWGDRFAINVDRGIVFVGINSKKEPFGLLTTDEQAIDLLVKNMIIETWTIGRKL